MKKRVVNVLLVAAFIACLVWAAVAPRMQALIPTILGIIDGEVLLSRNTDYIKHY